MRHSRLVVSWISLSLLLGPAGTPVAWASPSVIIEIFDMNGNTVSQEALHPGLSYIVKAHVLDGSGATVDCQPSFGKNNGVSGDQIGDYTPRPDGSAVMQMGNGFGTAEVTVQCQNPAVNNVSGKLQVANTKIMTPPTFNPPATPPPVATPPAETPPAGAPAAEAAGGMGGGALAGILLGGALAAGAVALALKASKGSDGPCTHPELACGNNGTPGYLGCCPADFQYICVSPPSVKGCYKSVFITGCTSKNFCTSEY